MSDQVDGAGRASTVIGSPQRSELTCAAEIADRLSLPVGTVKGRMRLGLDKLRHDTGP